jgi:hypothetical protein
MTHRSLPLLPIQNDENTNVEYIESKYSFLDLKQVGHKANYPDRRLRRRLFQAIGWFMPM